MFGLLRSMVGGSEHDRKVVRMTTRNIKHIFDPKRIAVIGASDEHGCPGSIALHNLIVERGDRVVYPVTAERESVHGVQAYPNVAAVPNLPDLALVCTEAAAVPEVVAQCGEAGILGVAILSSGFREAGETGMALEEQVRHVAHNYPDMRILGPNSFGVIVPRLGLNASLATGLPKQGHVAFVSQSQAISVATLDRALKEHIGFSHFVSIGSAIDINFSDLIDYFGADPWTRALILYVVSIDDVREFMSAARAFARNKPIVAYRSGRFAETTEGAVLHAGQMIGEDAVFDAALETCRRSARFTDRRYLRVCGTSLTATDASRRSSEHYYQCRGTRWRSRRRIVGSARCTCASCQRKRASNSRVSYLTPIRTLILPTCRVTPTGKSSRRPRNWCSMIHMWMPRS